MIIDLWTLLVENLFGSFWMAVIGIAVMIFVIFLIGKVSMVTTTNYIAIFLLAMSIGYGQDMIFILMFVLVLVVQIFAIPRMINS